MVTERDRGLEANVAERMRALMERALEGAGSWRQEHPRATFREIEEEVETRLGQVRQGLVESLAHESVSSDLTNGGAGERPRCECAGTLEARGQQTREVITLRGDRVRLERSYAVCGTCGAGVFPPR